MLLRNICFLTVLSILTGCAGGVNLSSNSIDLQLDDMGKQFPNEISYQVDDSFGDLYIALNFAGYNEKDFAMSGWDGEWDLRDVMQTSVEKVIDNKFSRITKSQSKNYNDVYMKVSVQDFTANAQADKIPSAGVFTLKPLQGHAELTVSFSTQFRVKKGRWYRESKTFQIEKTVSEGMTPLIAQEAAQLATEQLIQEFQLWLVQIIDEGMSAKRAVK